MGGAGVPADAAAVPLTQEVAADLGGSGHVGDVLTQAMAEEGLHPGAVVLWKQNGRFGFFIRDCISGSSGVQRLSLHHIVTPTNSVSQAVRAFKAFS